jgi:hypothetical protein
LALKLLSWTMIPRTGVAQRLRRGKWGYLKWLLYPHGSACSDPPVRPMRKRRQSTSDSASQMAPHYRLEILETNNATWEDVGEVTILEG